MALIASPAAAAGRPAPRASLSEIEQEVMCPTCGTPLMVADSPLADRERAFIRARIARGETKAQIERAMVAEFGPGILARPRRSGFDLSAYLVPLSAAALALALLAAALLRWRGRTGEPEPPAVADLPASVSRRLDEELARFDD